MCARYKALCLPLPFCGICVVYLGIGLSQGLCRLSVADRVSTKL